MELEQFTCPNCQGNYMLEYTVEFQRKELIRTQHFLKKKIGRIFKDKFMVSRFKEIEETLSKPFNDFWYCSNCSYMKPSGKTKEELQASLKQMDFMIKQETERLKNHLKSIELEKQAYQKMIQDLAENPSRRE